MRALRYALAGGGGQPVARRAGRCCCRSRRSRVALFVLGALPRRVRQPRRARRRAGRGAAEMSVYLDDVVDARPSARRFADADRAQRRRGGASSYVSKEEALARFGADVPRAAATSTASLDANPLPASFEVRLQPEAGMADGGAGSGRRRCARLPGVADVRYDQQWLAPADGGAHRAAHGRLGRRRWRWCSAPRTTVARRAAAFTRAATRSRSWQLVGAPWRSSAGRSSWRACFRAASARWRRWAALALLGRALCARRSGPAVDGPRSRRAARRCRGRDAVGAGGGRRWRSALSAGAAGHLALGSARSGSPLTRSSRRPYTAITVATMHRTRGPACHAS